MAKLDDLLEELVTANRILAREGVVDSFGHISVRHPDNPQRYLLSRSRAPDCIEKRRHHGVHARWRRRSMPGARALSRAVHPRRALRGAAGRDVGGAQPQPKASFRSASPASKIRPIYHMGAIDRARGAGLGLRTTSSAIPPCWSRTWRWAAISPSASAPARTALMRGHGATVAAQEHPARRLSFRSISRSMRGCRSRPWTWARHQVPHPRRGRQGRSAHRVLRHQPRLGELVPAGRAAFQAEPS